MMYALAKYTLLFFFTALLGFLLGFWFARRNRVHISESFADLRQANERSDARQWDRLFKYLEAAPEPRETDLSEVHSRLEQLANTVAALPGPEPVSFDSVNSRLDRLMAEIGSIPIPLDPGAPDFEPLIQRLERLETGIKAIRVPDAAGSEALAPVSGKLDRIEMAIRNIPQRAPAKETNLQPVVSKLDALEQTVQAMPRPHSANLAPIENRLQAIERELGSLGKRLAKSKGDHKARERDQQTSQKSSRRQPSVLSAALYGKKDDLKLITGVGPKLEELLNQNGVYYFWQVAEWNRKDIDVIDARLGTFKGRISRDNWVDQAKHLKAQPDAAQMPAEQHHPGHS